MRSRSDVKICEYCGAILDVGETCNCQSVNVDYHSDIFGGLPLDEYFNDLTQSKRGKLSREKNLVS